MIAALAIPVVASSVGASVDARAHVQSSDSPSEVLATLVVSTDKVSVRKDGKRRFRPAEDGQGLREGDTIRTDESGTAEIDYGNDAYTRLDVDTTFTIVVLTDEQGSRQVQGSLETGQTWNRTAALTESGSFEQEGAGANATVRGTAFAIECDAIDHCVFTAVVDDIDLTGSDGVTQLLTPLDQCDSSDTSGGDGELTGVLCADITQISADDLPDWIVANLLQDLIQRGIDDSGFLTGTVVVRGGTVSFVPTPITTPTTITTPPTQTAPGAPTNAAATAGNAQATVGFTPPASDGGSPITSYTVIAIPGAGAVGAGSLAVGAAASGSGSPITVSGLSNATSYRFTVTATNAIGTSPASTPSNAVTPIGPPPVINAQPVDIQTLSQSSPVDFGESIGPNVKVVSQDEGTVTFLLQVTNPGGGTYWVVFKVLPDPTFGQILWDPGAGLTPVVTDTQYEPTTVFTFDPVEIEPACTRRKWPTYDRCFTNGNPSEGPDASSGVVPYPSPVTPGPVDGSVQWSDSFTFTAENEQGRDDEVVPVEVELVAVDDICTTWDEFSLSRLGPMIALGCFSS